MLDDYLIVSQSVLPEVFTKVIEVKKLLDEGEVTQISEAIKKIGISRSAFYKYKNHVFVAEGMYTVRKTLISFVLSDQKGILSLVLNKISARGGNILTINQNIPIQKKANVVVGIDINSLEGSVQQLLSELEEIEGVTQMNLLSIE